MATSAFVNVRTTKLNEPNRFALTYNQRVLFDFYLTPEEMDELVQVNLKFAARIFEDRFPGQVSPGRE